MPDPANSVFGSVFEWLTLVILSLIMIPYPLEHRESTFVAELAEDNDAPEAHIRVWFISRQSDQLVNRDMVFP